jgi:hypothetical protein
VLAQELAQGFVLELAQELALELALESAQELDASPEPALAFGDTELA